MLLKLPIMLFLSNTSNFPYYALIMHSCVPLCSKKNCLCFLRLYIDAFKAISWLKFMLLMHCHVMAIQLVYTL